MHDEVIVAVLDNPAKKTLFGIDERLAMLEEATAAMPTVRVDSSHGLLVDYCPTHGIPAIVKGLRAVSDFDYELQMAQMNYRLAGVETLFVTTNPLSVTCPPAWSRRLRGTVGMSRVWCPTS